MRKRIFYHSATLSRLRSICLKEARWHCEFLYNSDFNLSVGCFGPTLSKIAPNGQIRDFTGSPYDGSAPNYVARLF